MVWQVKEEFCNGRGRAIECGLVELSLEVDSLLSLIQDLEKTTSRDCTNLLKTLEVLENQVDLLWTQYMEASRIHPKSARFSKPLTKVEEWMIKGHKETDWLDLAQSEEEDFFTLKRTSPPSNSPDDSAYVSEATKQDPWREFDTIESLKAPPKEVPDIFGPLIKTMWNCDRRRNNRYGYLGWGQIMDNLRVHTRDHSYRTFFESFDAYVAGAVDAGVVTTGRSPDGAWPWIRAVPGTYRDSRWCHQ